MKDESQQVCDALLCLVEQFKHTIFALAEARGITRMQFFALHSIYRSGELAMGQVAGALSCDASNVTGIVDRLVAQSLVVRQELPQDRRTKTLHLTAKGRQIIESLLSELPAYLGCSNLSKQEAQNLLVALQKLTHQKEQNCATSA